MLQFQIVGAGGYIEAQRFYQLQHSNILFKHPSFDEFDPFVANAFSHVDIGQIFLFG
jgi:hypothetical protein